MSGYACAACVGWSGSILYVESTMLVFSWNGSSVFYVKMDGSEGIFLLIFGAIIMSCVVVAGHMAMPNTAEEYY